jgi:hypothetical protein
MRIDEASMPRQLLRKTNAAVKLRRTALFSRNLIRFPNRTVGDESVVLEVPPWASSQGVH